MASVADVIANTALQECCQDIVDYIRVDLVMMQLHAKRWLTSEDLKLLGNISDAQEKKRQFYVLALAGKGSAAFEDIITVLKATAENHRPHRDLADKLNKHHKYLSQQSTDKHEQTQDEDTCDVDHITPDGSDHSDSYNDKSQLLPDVAQTNQSSASNLASNAADPNPVTGMFQSLSIESSKNLTQFSSSINTIPDHPMYYCPPTPVKVVSYDMQY